MSAYSKAMKAAVIDGDMKEELRDLKNNGEEEDDEEAKEDVAENEVVEEGEENEGGEEDEEEVDENEEDENEEDDEETLSTREPSIKAQMKALKAKWAASIEKAKGGKGDGVLPAGYAYCVIIGKF